MTLDDIVAATEAAWLLKGLTIDDIERATKQAAAELSAARQEFLAGSDSKGTPHVMHIINYRERRHRIMGAVATAAIQLNL